MREFDDVLAPSDSPLRRKDGDEAAQQGLLGRAAAAGRPDALGAAGVLKLQRLAGNAGTTAMMEEDRSPVHDVVASGGESLDRDVRTDMESSLGHDFSDVRVHRDAAAHESAQAVQAKAYTVGSHVVFQRDAYDPGSESGRHVLAHELTHVVQQRSGPVEGSSAPGGIRVSDPSDRFEQEASHVADAAMARSSAPAPSPAPASLQRAAAPEEEEVQAYVQRAAPEEEEEVQAYVQRAAPEEEEDVQAYVQRADEDAPAQEQA